MEPYIFFGFSNNEEYEKVINDYFDRKKIENQTIGRSRAYQELAFRDFIASENRKNAENSGNKLFWITINPKPGISLETLKKNTLKMYSKKWIKGYMYVYETTSNGHNHTHGLIVADYEISRARKELASTASSICDISNVHCFKFVVLDDPNVAQQKMNYMMGLKQSKKEENVSITKQWRKQNNLAELYESATSPLILLGLGRKSEDYHNILLT